MTKAEKSEMVSEIMRLQEFYNVQDRASRKLLMECLPETLEAVLRINQQKPVNIWRGGRIEYRERKRQEAAQ